MFIFIRRKVDLDKAKAIKAFKECNQNISIIIAQYILVRGGSMLFYTP